MFQSPASNEYTTSFSLHGATLYALVQMNIAFSLNEVHCMQGLHSFTVRVFALPDWC
jgi:hypothetical protein